MNINWKVRLSNRNFWITIIPQMIVLIQVVAMLFGFTIDLADLSGKLIAVVDALFVVVGTLGIVVDPTTQGIGDSERAMSYETPQ